MKLIPRDAPPRAVWALEQAGIHPLLARLYAARGVQHPDELDDALTRLLAQQRRPRLFLEQMLTDQGVAERRAGRE